MFDLSIHRTKLLFLINVTQVFAFRSVQYIIIIIIIIIITDIFRRQNVSLEHILL
jgi:hypothetical protein